MAYRFEHLEFDVHVHAEPSGHGAWLIHATLRYRDLLGVAAIARVAPEARFELMHGILQEDRRVRRLGATSVHVKVEGDGETANFFEILGRGRRQSAFPRRTPSEAGPSTTSVGDDLPA